jgi:hypothetical protein
MESQNKLILQHLKTVGSITPLDALANFQCFRLASRIFDLRQDGHEIHAAREELPSGKKIARYFLIKEASKGETTLL